MLKGLAEGTKGGDKLENLVFVTDFTWASVVATHQAWILGVEAVNPEFARGGTQRSR